MRAFYRVSLIVAAGSCCRRAEPARRTCPGRATAAAARRRPGRGEPALRLPPADVTDRRCPPMVAARWRRPARSAAGRRAACRRACRVHQDAGRGAEERPRRQSSRANATFRREEMCKLVSAYSAAEQKWLQFTEANVSHVRHPGRRPAQLKQAHARTEQTKQKICAAGPASAETAAPSLADALGTTRPPIETNGPAAAPSTR